MIVIGQFLSTHGFKGGIKLVSFTENPEDIFGFNLKLENGDSIKCKKIGNNPKDNIFIVLINDIDNINDVEKYKNIKIYLKKEDLEQTKKDQFYIDDLLDMTVICGEKKGIVNDVYNFGGGDCLEIIWNNNQMESIPFIDQYVKEVDIKNKTIYLEKPKYI